MPKITHLTVFPGTACNMDCSYCYLHNAVNGNAGGENSLSADGAAILRGIAAFVRYAERQEKAGTIPHGEAKITFLGGEPLLHGKWLKKWIIAARRLSPEMPLRVFTNGTLLDTDWLDFFKYNDVSIALSLDGEKAANDRFRKFRNSPDSVYDAVIAAIPSSERQSISVCAVITPQTAELLPESLFHIGSLGFGSVGWAPDMACLWTDGDLSVLSAAAESFRRQYINAAKGGQMPFRISNMYETLAEMSGIPMPQECGSITLAGDGRFYPCDKLISLPTEQISRHILDFPSDSSDWERKRESFFNELDRRGGKFRCNACTAGILARLDGLSISASEKTKIFIGQQKLSLLVRNELRILAEEGLKISCFREAHHISPDGEM